MSPANSEISDLLTEQPSPKAILAVKSTLDREDALADVKADESDACEQLEHLMILLKAKASVSV